MLKNPIDPGEESDSDDEDRIYLEGDLKLRAIQEIEKTEENQADFVELGELLCERASLKLTETFGKLRRQLKWIYNEAFNIYAEQQTLMEGLKGGRLTIELGTKHTYFEFLEWLTKAAKSETYQWTRIYPAMKSDYKMIKVLPSKYRQYTHQTKMYLRTAIRLAKLFVSIVESGLYVFCRLSPSQLTQDFVNSFGCGLNDLKLLLSIVRCIESTINIDFSDLKPIDLNDFLQRLAVADGQLITELLTAKLAKFLPQKPSDTAMNARASQMSELVDLEVPAPKKNSRPDPTSDYYSSSASSHRTEERLPPIKPHRITMRNVKLHNTMHELYSIFLEQRYTVFTSIVDAIALHRRLLSGQAVPAKKSAERRKRGVSFLDDCFQKHRKKLWRAYVIEFWMQFENQLVKSLEQGSQMIPSMRVNDLQLIPELISVVKEALLAVPLPDELAPPDLCITFMEEIYRNMELISLVGKVLQVSRTDKCHLLEEERGRKATATGHLFSQLQLVAQTADQVEKHKIEQLHHNWISVKSAQHLATYKLENYFSVRFFDARAGNKEEASLLRLLRQTDEMFREKLVSTTKSCLKESIPTSVVMKKQINDGPSDYILYVLGTAMEPIVVSSRAISVKPRLKLLTETLRAVFAAWITYLIENRMKLRKRCCEQLENDLLVHTRSWIRSFQAQAILTSDECEKLCKLPVFDELKKGIGVLLGEVQPPETDATVKFNSRNKIAPSIVTGSQPFGAFGSTETVDIRLHNIDMPSLLQWKKLKKTSLSPCASCL